MNFSAGHSANLAEGSKAILAQQICGATGGNSRAQEIGPQIGLLIEIIGGRSRATHGTKIEPRETTGTTGTMGAMGTMRGTTRAKLGVHSFQATSQD